jgi:hypothetical protein
MMMLFDDFQVFFRHTASSIEIDTLDDLFMEIQFAERFDNELCKRFIAEDTR